MTDISFTVTIGWWVLPFVTTAVLLLWALWPRARERSRGGDYSFPDIISPLLRLVPAITISLASWLTWSLMR